MPNEKSVNFGNESENSKSLDNRARGQCRVGLATRAHRVRLRGQQLKQSWIWDGEANDDAAMHGSAIFETGRNPRYMTMGQNELETPSLARNFRTAAKAGLPVPQSRDSADWGWVQHMHASLNDQGRAAVVIDTGAASPADRAMPAPTRRRLSACGSATATSSKASPLK